MARRRHPSLPGVASVARLAAEPAQTDAERGPLIAKALRVGRSTRTGTFCTLRTEDRRSVLGVVSRPAAYSVTGDV